ncbi:hypothetical protein [Sphingomonas sp. T9W2]|uniref:hypothetical protein n=1 Tax=Sphingomonas sp. T9W2 TaxID=3143183 RepID=UPI0031F4AE2A
MFGRAGTYGQCCVAVAALLFSVPSAAQLARAVTVPPGLGVAYSRLGKAMAQDLLDCRDPRKHVTLIDWDAELISVVGDDGLDQQPGAGKQVTRPFTHVWNQRSDA